MMNIKYLSHALCVGLSLLGLAACSEDHFGAANGQGKIHLDVEVDQSYKSRADEALSISSNDLKIRLTSSDGEVSEFASVSKFEAEHSFPVGSYLLEAYLNDATTEGFDCPYIYGAAEFDVVMDQTTQVNLTAALSNTLVKVNYSDAVSSYFEDFYVVLLSKSGKGVEYPADETRPAYLMPGKVEVLFYYQKQKDGDVRNKSCAEFTASAATCYSLNIDANGGTVDQASLTITFNDDLETQELEVDLSDDLIAATAPEVMAEGFTDEAIAFVTGDEYTGGALQFNAIARGKLQNVILTTTNPTYVNANWPASVDLMSLSDAEIANFKSMGLSAVGLWKNPEQMAAIDLSGVVQKIRLPKGTDNGRVTFTLSVTDMNGKVNETAPTLTLDATRGQISLQTLDEVLYDDTEMTLKATYNGANLSNVKFQYLSVMGTWVTLTPTKTIDNQDGSYNITLPKDIVYPLQLKAVEKETNTMNEASLEVPLGPALKITDNNIWATKVDVYVWNGGTYYDSGFTKGYHSTDGTNWTEVAVTDLGPTSTGAHLYRITGLTAGAKNYVKLNHPSNSSKLLNATSCTTEAAIQVPYNSMENWYSSHDGKNYKIYWPGDNTETQWGTNNPMTTSAGSDLAYCRNSGTIPYSSGKSGKCALLKSIGWGNGNTAAGDLSSRVMKYGDAGLLHLGSSRSSRPSDYSGVAGPLTTDDLSCGIDFATRPSSLSFYYKYSPKNSKDTGYVEYWIKDSAGNILSSGSKNLSSASTFTEVSLSFSYGVNINKAAKLYIKFLSSSSRDYLTKSTNNFTSPTFGNLSDGEYLGSQLYIDDITLNY